MSYPQAFHTSCREGLSGHPGFQFNAASAGLDSDQLARLAAAHAGYRLPPDASPEPDPAEVAALPVSLRYLPVDGIGPVVSRTAYVGREFRGYGDEPDGGRHGNYFSHIVVGAGESFGDLHPIELWAAPHWSTRESSDTRLPPLSRLEPGPLDLDAVLRRLMPPREKALAAVAAAALQAALGGPRLVVVEPDPDLAPLWVAWATFALPQDRVGDLTFSTFEARPRTAAVRLCVTTPACDLDFASYELGSSVSVLEVAAVAPSPAPLYGRAVAALAARGAEAVTAAVRSLAPGLDLDTAGAALVAVSGSADLVEAAELPATVAALRALAERSPLGRIAASAAALPTDPGSAAAAVEWSRLHALARQRADDEAAAELADESLRRLLEFLAAGGEGELVRVPPEPPVAPSVSVLARWMELVSTAPDPAHLARLTLAGSRLALIGCNAALDRELATLLAESIADPAIAEAYREVADNGGSRVVEALALRLGADAVAGGSVGPLERIAVDPVARRALRQAADGADSFEPVAAWELLHVRADPAALGQATATLAALATTEGQAATIGRLFGDAGPGDPAGHATLLQGWIAAGRAAPSRDQEAALECLTGIPFSEAERAVALWEALRGGPAAVRGDVGTRAWGLRLARPPQHRRFGEWARELAELLGTAGLRPGTTRRRELEGLAAAAAVRCLPEEGYGQGIEDLIEATDVGWLHDLGAALAGALDRALSPEEVLAEFFVGWLAVGRGGEPLLEVALPAATRERSAKELEAVATHLSPRRQPTWEEWLERHPPRRAVTRAVRGVLRRGDSGR